MLLPRGAVAVPSSNASLAASNTTAAFANAEDGGIDENDFSPGYSDMQTLILAGVATLIVLVFALVAAFAVGFVWQKLRERAADGYEGVLQRDESSDPLAVKCTSSSGNLLTEELKTAEDLDEVTSQSPLLTCGASSGSLQNHANGSVITMTMKNNQLIVETQERGVRLQDGAAKTTTTTFTTSSSPDHESVFVVEVTQPSNYKATSEGDDGSEQAQVHHGAEAEEPAKERLPSNTGLSQSDLSVSSAGSGNPSYRYGNQRAYDGGHFGYPEYSGYSTEGAKEPTPPSQRAPHRREVCWGGQDSILCSDQQSDSRPSLETLPEGSLLSDLLQEELLQEEQRQLGNEATSLHRTGSLPPRLKDKENTHTESQVKLNPVEEVEDSGISSAVEARKRGSLPIITPDLYKQTKNLILEKKSSGLSPKFERLRNDISPLDEVNRTEEENGEYEHSNTKNDNSHTKKEYENEAFVAADPLVN